VVWLVVNQNLMDKKESTSLARERIHFLGALFLEEEAKNGMNERIINTRHFYNEVHFC